MQSTFSTPAVLNSASQKPYIRSQNFPPQDLGMTISAIISLKYNIPHRASHILNPSLSLLIKSIISISGGQPTPVIHIPQYLTAIFEHLQLDPLIENYISFINVSFLMALLNLSQQTNPTFNTLINQVIIIPLAHNH
ncbi:hypothetical protein O181_000757 [Austropuccinia psidii MF-1]|uniref:Uncharacterized protein n=1 Tax=Austropuccinia psidii MF-1 TaxID=1389203 RepID=A0A9Q3B9H9_9BASI|nr:hypothetical protein [Austropuccinia psidii MF-1]